MLTVKLSRNDFCDLEKWQQIAEALELPPVNKEVIVMRIPGLLPVELGMKIDIKIKQPDEWMIGESIDGKRQWIVHTQKPRFLAEIIDDDKDVFNPPFEYQMRNGQWLCNFTWYDYPAEDITILCLEAEDAIETYDRILDVDN
jgi:hypothetical protein